MLQCEFPSPKVFCCWLFLLRKIFKVRVVLTLYVKEQVGANKGEYHHGDGQSTVRNHLSDLIIQIWAVGGTKHLR